MRLSVRFNGKWFVIPCGEAKVNSVQWLVEETIRRSKEQAEKSADFTAQNFEVVLAQSGGKLELKDTIKEVLNDNDFVHISGESLCSIMACILRAATHFINFNHAFHSGNDACINRH